MILKISTILVIFQLHLCTSLSQIQYAVLEQKGQKGSQLSAWELYVLNDLFFQIAIKKCPKISRPTASFLQNFITEAVKMAPRNHEQNPEFLPTYTKLLACFDVVDKESKNPGKKLESVRFIDSDPNDPFSQDFRNKKKNKHSTEKPELNHAWQDGDGKWHLNWVNKISNMFSNLFVRTKRNADEESEKMSEEEVEVQPTVRKYSGIIKKDGQAKHAFANLLHDINKLVRMSCPGELKPSGHFSKIVIREIMYWVAKDTHSLTAAAMKYFNENSILDDIDECFHVL